MIQRLWIFIVILSLNVFADTTANVNKNGVILDGYDPVAYFQAGKPIKGESQFQSKVGDVIYWFSSQSNKELFLKDTKKYEPQFGGWCAFAVADSKSKVEIDPKSFLIQDGRLLLFYNGIWADTRHKWQNSKNKDSKTYLKEADENWPSTKTKEP